MVTRGSDVLAYTVSYGNRSFLGKTVPAMRGTAGQWFDWVVYLGNPEPSLHADASCLLEDASHLGIQFLVEWPENRGQHHATAQAFAWARECGYKWLVRIDDDIKPRTKRWLKRMVTQLETLRKLAGDDHDRIVAAPKIVGLQHPLTPVGTLDVGQNFPVDTMEILGGGCRIHPVDFFEGFEPDIYAPLGRKDPQQIAHHTLKNKGVLVRFPNIRVEHHTTRLEAEDDEHAKHARNMGHYWCYLGEEV